MVSNKTIGQAAVLTGIAFSVAFFVWQLIDAGVSIRELALTAAGGALLFTPLSLVVAIIIAKMTKEWKEGWKDITLGAVGLLLFWLGVYGAFTTHYTLIGKAVGIAGVVLAAASTVLTPAREVVKEVWQ